MKKLVVILFALCCTTAVFAEDAANAAKFSASASGIMYGTNYKSVLKDDGGDYSAFRIRPLFTFSNGSLDAVLKLEYDATFGDVDAAGTGDDTVDGDIAKSGENVGLAADKKGLEVANAYIKTKVDGLSGLTILGGIAGYDFPLVWGDNAPMGNINFAIDPLDLNLYYVKVSEGSNNDAKDDSQIYIADAKIKLGESSIRPALFAYQSRKEAITGIYKDSVGYIPAISANFVVGQMGLDAAFAYATGKDKSTTTEVEYKAYACDIAPYFKLNEQLKLTAFFTLMSGDDGSDAEEDTSFVNATIDGGGAGINIWRLYIIEDAGSFTTNSDVANAGKYSNTFGYRAYGLCVDGSFGAIAVKLQGAYVTADKTPSGVKKDMGIEFDANVGYQLTKGSTLYVEGAYLKTGKLYDTYAAGQTPATKKQDAQYVNVGVSYSL